MATIPELLDRGWAEHDGDADGVATRLAEALGRVAAPEHVEPFARLAAHVCGEHLGDSARGVALLRALRALPACDAAGAAAIARWSAALACAAGDESELATLVETDAAHALALAASMRTGQRDLGRAAALYERAAGRLGPTPADGAPAIRALAVVGNNLASALQEKTARSGEEDAAMVGAARRALAYWKLAGTWLEHERAEFVLARSLTLARDARAGAEAARRCLALCERNAAPAFERFFGELALAEALRATGDAPGFAAARDRALAHYARVPADERRWCEAELRALG